jgi:hypothetical protein
MSDAIEIERTYYFPGQHRMTILNPRNLVLVQTQEGIAHHMWSGQEKFEIRPTFFAVGIKYAP